MVGGAALTDEPIASPEKETPGFVILSVVQRPLKQDGTPQKNAFAVRVRVDDVDFEIPIRTTSASMARLPDELHDHPLAEELKKAVTQRLVNDLLAQVRRRRPDRF